MSSLNNKFVAVLNEKLPSGKALNALAHMAAGLVGLYPNLEDLRFDSYIDQDNNSHKSISDHPFIILKAKNSNKLRSFREALIEEGLIFTDFTDTMTVGTHEEQKQRTRATKEADLEYYGVCTFGRLAVLNPLTKKFSLWQ